MFISVALRAPGRAEASFSERESAVSRLKMELSPRSKANRTAGGMLAVLAIPRVPGPSHIWGLRFVPKRPTYLSRGRAANRKYAKTGGYCTYSAYLLIWEGQPVSTDPLSGWLVRPQKEILPRHTTPRAARTTEQVGATYADS